MSPQAASTVAALRAFGLTYPGTEIKSPWPGHADLAVAGKTFAYLPTDDQPFKLSFKLPFSAPAVLELPFAALASYGLGRSGWVTLTPADDEIPAMAQLRDWMDESYRAQAPKRLIAQAPVRP